MHMASKILRCATCDNEIEVLEEQAGKVVRCLKCSGVIAMPGVTARRRVPGNARLGRFQLINVLSRGPRSTVYRALDTEKLRLVALKQFGTAGAPDAAAVTEWVERARRVVPLDHPALVKVYEIGTEEGAAFLAMSLVEGLPLHAAAQSAGPALFPLLTAVRDVARAVAYLHGRDFTHGRVTSEHVLIGEGGGAVLGSVDGAAPGRNTSADLRDLGRLVYESVVRQPADAAVAPHELGIELQRDLEYLAVKAARGEYASAAELASDIDRYLCGKPLVRDTIWKRLLGG
jgi:serine/threonine-protein kinase